MNNICVCPVRWAYSLSFMQKDCPLLVLDAADTAELIIISFLILFHSDSIIFICFFYIFLWIVNQVIEWYPCVMLILDTLLFIFFFTLMQPDEAFCLWSISAFIIIIQCFFMVYDKLTATQHKIWLHCFPYMSLRL